MTDKIKAAIVAELKRQAEGRRHFCQDGSVLREEGSEDVLLEALTFDGQIILDELVEAVKRAAEV